MKLAVSRLEVVSAYVIEGLEIPVFGEGEEPRHLILTGPNGSGKSSILRGLSRALETWPNTPTAEYRSLKQSLERADPTAGDAHPGPQRYARLRQLESMRSQLGEFRFMPLVEPEIYGTIVPASLVIQHSSAHRRFQPAAVSGPNRFTWPAPSDPQTDFSQSFLQYLINRRSEQAFARERGDDQAADELKSWFETLQRWLGQLMDLSDLELHFDPKTFEFKLSLADGRETAFSTLPDGFASALSLWAEIFLRVEAIEGEASGWVLIDEPELHMHPELQEQLLPFLTQQFPQLQFIVATHSPMVATSLANATVYDLELRRPKRGEELQGYRYGNILKSHFGLRTDFDAATTAKLDRLYALNQIEERSDEQDAERRSLAKELGEHHHLLALEVLKEFVDD